MSDEWWVSALGKALVWARLRVTESGTAQVLDFDGKTLTYDSDDSARAALMDAEFRAFDGLDEDDARGMGFTLGAVQPPQAQDDDALRERMFMALPTLQ